MGNLMSHASYSCNEISTLLTLIHPDFLQNQSLIQQQNITSTKIHFWITQIAFNWQEFLEKILCNELNLSNSYNNPHFRLLEDLLYPEEDSQEEGDLLWDLLLENPSFPIGNRQDVLPEWKKAEEGYNFAKICLAYWYTSPKHFKEKTLITERVSRYEKIFYDLKLPSLLPHYFFHVIIFYARCHQYGIGMAMDKQKAFLLYQSVIADYPNHPGGEAYREIGSCYLLGVGIEKNEELGMVYYQLAIDHGNHFALASIGFCFDAGRGVQLNSNEAYRYYLLSMEEQVFCLGDDEKLRHQEADKLPIRRNGKRRSLRISSGNSAAMNNLAIMYRDGKGVIQRDPFKAFYYFSLGTKLGNLDCMGNLAWCLRMGYGCKSDRERAIKCYRYLAYRGHENAVLSLNLIGVALESDEDNGEVEG